MFERSFLERAAASCLMAASSISSSERVALSSALRESFRLARGRTPRGAKAEADATRRRTAAAREAMDSRTDVELFVSGGT